MKELTLNLTEQKQLESICNLLYSKPGVQFRITGNYITFLGPRLFFGTFWPKRKRIHYLDLCLSDIPKKLSKLKWKNLDLVATFHEGAMDALRNPNDSIVNYLFSEVLKVKIPKIFLDCETVFIPLPGSSVYLKEAPFNRTLSLNLEDNKKTILPLRISKGKKHSEVNLDVLQKAFRELTQEAKIVTFSLLLYLGIYTAQLLL